MADPIWEFDPTAEGTGTALTISTGNYGVTAFSAPSPPPKLQWAGSVDTEGSALASRGHENCVVTMSLEVTGASALATLQDKLAKLHREGGTLKYTSPAGTERTYDVLIQDGWSPTFDHLHYLGGVTACQFSLTCKPYNRGPEQDLGDNTETTLPALVFTEASIPGEVPALGRLVIDDDSAVSQWWLAWGLQSRYYSSSANAALFYEAEGRTVLGGSATAAGAGTVSGGGSNTVENTSLTSDYKAILSTQATGGGAHLSHVGTFRVYARVTNAATSGTVTVALEWSEGDFLQNTRNPEVSVAFMQSNTWKLIDLGLVSLRAVTSGTQRWEGRLIAKTDVVSSDFLVDYLMLVPVDEGSGIVSGVDREISPTSYSAEDHFTSTTAAAALNARVAPTGGTWATSGDATDFAFIDATTGSATEAVARGASTSTNGRFGILGSTNYTSVVVQATISRQGTPASGHEIRQGVIARWTDSSNFLKAYMKDTTTTPDTDGMEIVEVVSGVSRTVASLAFPLEFFTPWPTNTQQRLRLTVTANGVATLQLFNEAGSLVVKACQGYSRHLATGGTLATGKPGIWDYSVSSSHQRIYDDFYVWVPPVDAAMFASQSLEIRHDRVQREDSGGAMWIRPSSYQGDYLLVPASGSEARTSRMIVKGSRNDPSVADPGIDDISARLFVTPRYLAPPA